jgi:hypothetical protein
LHANPTEPYVGEKENERGALLMKLLGPVSGAPISHPLECRVVIGVLLLPMDQPAWSAAEPSIDGQNAVITTTLPYGTAETACTDLDSECHVPGRLFPIYSSQAEKRPIRTPRTAAPPFSAPYVRVENKKQKIHLSWLNRRDSTFVTKTKSGRSSAQ